MNRDEARDYIIDRAKQILQPDNSRKGWVCPICGSGSGTKGTGITTKDGIHFTYGIVLKIKNKYNIIKKLKITITRLHKLPMNLSILRRK